MRLAALTVLLLALMSSVLPAGADPVQAPPAPRVVVTPIDSGINPYHEFFQVAESSVTQDVLDEFGIDSSHVLTLSDTYEEDGEAFWTSLKEGELYHFTGTNIIAVNLDGRDRKILPDGSNHGVGVAGSVVRGNPEAIVLFVAGSGADAEDWAFDQPGIDIVTTSYGFATAVPLPAVSSRYTGVVEGGKAHFGASPNDPSLASVDGTSGPWWVVSMAGYAEGDDEGKELLSGTSPEFVADFTQDLPYCATCTTELSSPSGTSFATPLAAGVASAVLLEARQRTGHVGGITAEGLMVDADGIHLDTWDLRRSLQEGAVLPASSGVGFGTLPTLPVAPYAVVGWGAITPDPELDVIGRSVAWLMGDEDAPDAKGGDTCAFMNAHFDARLYSWNLNPASDSFGDSDGAGYIRC